jgi:hypothetical protein
MNFHLLFSQIPRPYLHHTLCGRLAPLIEELNTMQLMNKRLLSAWLLGIPLSYFFVGYLENFYRTSLEIALWTVSIHALVGLFVYYLIGKVIREIQSKSVEALISGILFAALLVFAPAMYAMARPFPNLFDAGVFHLSSETWLAFAIGLAPAFPIAAWLLTMARRGQWTESRFFKFVDENLNGLLVALLFFAVYLIFASIFNRPSYDADDMFFDADGNLYRGRFGTENYRDYYWRQAHPYILIIVRPLVGMLAFLFKGDMFFAAFTLNALVGGLCVFLVWYFVRHSTQNPLYASLISSLFGATSTQLAFGSILESYIHLSAIALIFLVLLLKNKPLPVLIVAGLVTFGITFSNIVQTFFAHFFVKRNIKQIIIYGIVISMLVVPLSLLNNWIYPNSQPYFWDLSPLEREDHNRFPPTLGRANLLARTMTLHSFVAPVPLIIRDGWPFAKVWMFRAAIKNDPMQIATYETLLGNGLARFWAGLMLLGAVFFLKNIFKQDNGYFLTFIFTVLFFFAFHMMYGKDVFLYSANWTYAITLFLALAWRELADKRWFQVILLVFVLLLLINNSQLLHTMMEISSPSVPYPVWR